MLQGVIRAYRLQLGSIRIVQVPYLADEVVIVLVRVDEIDDALSNDDANLIIEQSFVVKLLEDIYIVLILRLPNSSALGSSGALNDLQRGQVYEPVELPYSPLARVVVFVTNLDGLWCVPVRLYFQLGPGDLVHGHRLSALWVVNGVAVQRCELETVGIQDPVPTLIRDDQPGDRNYPESLWK